ncbi:MAG: DUF2207 domain-containing protein [Armatimonadota bacterium]
MKFKLLKLLAFAIVITTFISADCVFSKSYYHPLIEQVFELRQNGDVVVTDTRTFSFDGDFSWAELEIKNASKDYNYTLEFRGVWDKNTGQQLQSQVIAGHESQILKWFYTANNETKVFEIKYVIRNIVGKYSDVAQFYWKAVEDDHAKISQVNIKVIPPAKSPDLFKVFVHSKAGIGDLIFADDFSYAKVSMNNIPETSFVELNVLLDPKLFAAAPLLTGKTYESILQEEKENFEKAEREAKSLLMAIYFAIGVGVIMIIAFAVVYANSGKEPDTGYNGIYEREPPDYIPPAVLPAILEQGSYKQDKMGDAFGATLIECARLGYLEINEYDKKGFLRSTNEFLYVLTEKGKKLLSGGNIELAEKERPLESFEKDVLTIVFNQAGSGETSSTEQIEKWGKKIVGEKSNFLIFIERWGPEMRKWYERKYYELDDRRSAAVRNYFIAALVMLSALPLVFRKPEPVIVSGIIGAILILISIKTLSRRTPEAALMRQKWMAFKRFITDFSAMKESGPNLLHMWDHYLVYAVSLGVAKKMLENLELVAKEYNTDLHRPIWYTSSSSQNLSSASMINTSSLQSLSKSMSNFQSMSRALSSSSSSGGGFSGGGGGGGGGGSSRAG